MTGPTDATALMLARYVAGENVQDIAAERECHPNTIYQAAIRHGFKGYRPKPAPRGRVPAIIRLREAGHDYQTIKDRLGVSKPMISQSLRRWRPDLLALGLKSNGPPAMVDRKPAG